MYKIYAKAKTWIYISVFIYFFQFHHANHTRRFTFLTYIHISIYGSSMKHKNSCVCVLRISKKSLNGSHAAFS